MGQFFDEIPAHLFEWIANQHVFWVATAPLSIDGHVNISPKGVEGCFHVTDPKTVWYEDLSGSGVETISHLRENGRITVLFNAFEGPPRICRLFGTGVVHEFGSPEYDRFISPENRRPGGRSVIVIDVHKVGTSCGYAVPYFSFNSHRTQLLEFFQRHEKEEHAAELAEAAEIPKPELSNAKNRPEKGIRQYWINKNLRSIDGLPGLHVAPFCDKPFRWSERDIERARELREKTAKEADKDKVNQQTPASSKQLDQRGDYVRMTLAFAAGVATMAAYHQLVVRTW